MLGLARSGLAAARLALARGARVYASDGGDTPVARAAAAEIERLGGEAEVGGHDVERARCVRSDRAEPGHPAVSRDPARARASRSLRRRRDGVRLRAAGRARSSAITGTNGKTTVTALTAHLLQSGRHRAVAGGNIGTAALRACAAPSRSRRWWCVEVSSFQLARLRAIRTGDRDPDQPGAGPPGLVRRRRGVLRRQGAALHERGGRQPSGC